MAANLTSGLGTHSRIPGLYRPGPGGLVWRTWAREVLSIFGNRNFVIAVVGGMLAAVPAALTGGLLIYFNTYIFDLPSRSVMLLVATQAVSAPAGFLLASSVSARLQKRPAYLLLYVASLAFVHGPLLLWLCGLMPPNGAPILLPMLMAAHIVAGILGIGASIVNTSMIADVVEENQAKTARRSEGLVLFSDRLMLKLASGLATILPGVLLALVGFPEGADPKTLDPAVMRHLAMAYVALSVTLSSLAILTWLMFRIDHAAHERNLAAVAAQRRAAEGEA
jgi:Na+/melibiose symporter-like transporter